MLLHIKPHTIINANVRRAHHLLQQRAYAMINMQIVQLVCGAVSKVVVEVGIEGLPDAIKAVDLAEDLVFLHTPLGQDRSSRGIWQLWWDLYPIRGTSA